MIYGSTFFFSKGLMCYRTTSKLLWVLTLVLIIFGFIDLISWVRMIILIFHNPRPSHPPNSLVMPSNEHRSIDTAQFSSIDQTESNSCPICHDDFEPTDQVSELKCQGKHIFHTRCIEKSLKLKVECPACRSTTN